MYSTSLKTCMGSGTVYESVWGPAASHSGSIEGPNSVRDQFQDQYGFKEQLNDRYGFGVGGVFPQFEE